jgi:hypothetical protein
MGAPSNRDSVAKPRLDLAAKPKYGSSAGERWSILLTRSRRPGLNAAGLPVNALGTLTASILNPLGATEVAHAIFLNTVMAEGPCKDIARIRDSTHEEIPLMAAFYI